MKPIWHKRKEQFSGYFTDYKGFRLAVWKKGGVWISWGFNKEMSTDRAPCHSFARAKEFAVFMVDMIEDAEKNEHNSRL